MDYSVRISDEVLESMSLAAIEAYCLGDGNKKKKDKLETLGYIWGFKRVEEDHTVFYVSKISISISAVRSSDSVLPNPEALSLKNSLVKRWSPQLTLLGDFHTHPYDNLDDVTQVTGFNFSDADFSSFKEDDVIWEESNGQPLMLAMTICRLGRVRDSWATQPRNNVCSYSVGEFRFWLNSSVGFLDDNGDRDCTGNTRSPVFLDLNSRFFNMSGDRIQERMSAI